MEVCSLVADLATWEGYVRDWPMLCRPVCVSEKETCLFHAIMK